jgi:predicted DNA binding CopG/RHH family protein
MRVTRELLEGVTAAAQRRGVPLSVYMRDALVAALADDQPDDLTAA